MQNGRLRRTSMRLEMSVKQINTICETLYVGFLGVKNGMQVTLFIDIPQHGEPQP